MNLNVGDTLFYARYRIERVLGQGGFGITYLCEQTGLGRKVAIKEFFMHEYCERDRETASITLGSSGSRDMVERFRQKFIKEARALAALNHKHIVRIIDIFEENNTAYYVMEYVGGGSLSDKVKDGALPEDEAVRYIRQVATALELVHSRRMMHLDIKPSNILLNENDEAVLIDFGLAKQYDAAGSQTSTTPVGISHGYAPLEQYRQGGVGTFSPATDIYSLGATLYKLLTGQTPPEAGDVMNEGLPELPVGISDNVRKTVETAMQPAVRKRPQSVGEFLSLLDKKVKAENGKVETESNDAGETVLLTNDKLSPCLRGTSNDVAEGVEERKVLHADAGSTVVENSSTPGGEIPDGCVISSESEKSLENCENEILHSAQNDKEQKPVVSSERSDGEISSTDAGETVLLTNDKLSPCLRGTSNDVAEGVEECKVLHTDDKKCNSPKRPFSKRLITIISVAAICIIAAFFGVKSCNDRKAAEAEAQQATAIAEQQRIDADRKAQKRADSIAAEQQRVSFSLEGRSPGEDGIAIPKEKLQAKGRVVVNITVAPNGRVISTSINSKGTNTADLKLRNAAEKAAKNTIFNSIAGVDNQSGTITYNFEIIEADRKAKEEADRKAKEEADRLAAEKKRKEEAERKHRNEYARTHGSINGHNWVDLGLSVKWATCNVGASVPEEYGGYYAWGEIEEKSNYDWSTYKWCRGSNDTMTKYCTNSSYGTVDNKTVLIDDVAHVKWGGSWRMPTKAEQDELRKYCTWIWTTQNGVEGYKVTGPNGNSIFLPAAGYRLGTEANYSGSLGYYWSSSLYEGYSYSACYLYFNSGYYVWSYSNRYYGYSVRPVCE